MQVKKDLTPNYFFLTLEKLEEFEKRFDQEITLGELVLMTVNHKGLKGNVDKSFFLEVTDRDFYNAVCTAFEKEKQLTNKTENE